MRTVWPSRIADARLGGLRRQLAGAALLQPPGLLSTPPAEMAHDRLSVVLGQGDDVWGSAVAALARWGHFDVGWAGVTTDGRPPHVGQDVLVHAHAIGLTFLAPCRVIAADRLAAAVHSYGFTYAPLVGHLETGEERFAVSRDPMTDEVRYEIDVVAAPARLYAKIGRPIVDRYRSKFRRDSVAAMVRAVGEHW